MPASHSAEDTVGAIFTPLVWAKWLVRTFALTEKWIDGATICDPTAGEGVFVHALIDSAAERGVAIDDTLLRRLFLADRDPRFINNFHATFYARYARKFPIENTFITDVVLDSPRCQTDVLVGNPPWCAFTDLPTSYKAVVKSHFLNYGLVSDRRALLLGASRIDFAALVICKTIRDWLLPNGEAVMFCPLSLFLNDASHAGFRNMSASGVSFGASSIHDFGDEMVFDQIATRYAAVRFVRDTKPKYPVPYRVRRRGKWEDKFAAPLHDHNGPLSVLESHASWLNLRSFSPISINRHQTPRQGINTCGANEVFIFTDPPDFIPSQFIYPLVGRHCFDKGMLRPQKHILVLHDRSGLPLNESLIRKFPELWTYLESHRARLCARKGSMIGAWIKRGKWWACLGVGSYSFAPYKVMWEAMGKKTFTPVLLSTVGDKAWQGNQAMHCFVPAATLHDAERIIARLRNPGVEEYLLSFRMAGTCSWAQVGRMKRLFCPCDDVILTGSEPLFTKA